MPFVSISSLSQHALTLPAFALMWSDISSTAVRYTMLPLEPLPGPLAALSPSPQPVIWLFLLGNVVSQYVCIRGVFTLTTITSSLTVTLTLTLRKFASLLLSICYFANPFTPLHWLGSLSTFAGSLIFFGVHKHLFASKTDDKSKVE